MKIEPRSLSGFMELMPDEQILFNSLKEIIIDTYEKYGFLPLDTPVIEYSNVLLAKSSNEVTKQIYRFNRGDNDLSLRFDLTVPLAKYVAKRSNELTFPFKRYQVGKVYRGERPQKGRFREFYQCDIDIIGDGKLELLHDAEIPSIIYDLFNKLNVGKFIIRINNRKIFNGLFKFLNLDDKSTDILRIIDKIDKIGKEAIINELKELDILDDTIDYLMDFITVSGNNKEKLEYLEGLNIKNDEFSLGLSELKTVIEYLYNMGIPDEYFSIDLTIARGLDYYTGTVYETILKDYPSIGSVCSGGRYENLAEYYTDKKLPGVGISIGLTRLFYQLREANVISPLVKTTAKVLLIPMTDDLKYSLKIAKLTRDNNVSLDICYLDKSIKQKLKYASKIKVPYVVLIGEDEINNNTLTLKDMFNGIQKTLSITEYLKVINKGEYHEK